MIVIEKIETALAIEKLAYHNKNYLSNDLRNNSKRSEVMQRLLREVLDELKKPLSEKRNRLPIAWNGKCPGCKKEEFQIVLKPTVEVSEEMRVSVRCYNCGNEMLVKYKCPDLCETHNPRP